MNAKQNAQEIIRFGKPERVVSGLPSYGLCYHGCNHEGYRGGGHNCPVGSKWTDVWGTEWHKEHEGVMGFPRGNPLAEPQSLKTYQWPDPTDERICALIYQKAKEFPGGDLFLGGAHRDTLWEKAYMLVGMENMMVYFHTEPNFAREVLHRIMDFQLGIAAHYLKIGVESVGLGDDMGTQQGPLLGPRIMREFLVPEYKRLFDLYRAKGVIIGFHSCGCIEDVLPIFMELGVNVLNPIQATANNLEKVRRITQGKMALQGGVSTATIMDGPVAVIEQEVRKRLWQLGRDGGYFCGPDQGMPFPKPHIDAVYAAIEKFGRYPIEKQQTASTKH
jgi:uroporphyrinogen decarboxylase